tara:strand:- start:675 stop:938 length:264 start_codon:yes stop_codon:yes gene_type:complete
MCKRNYKITPKEFSFGKSFQVEVWDTYGRYTEVYEKDVVSAWKFIYDYWDKEEENKKSDECMNRAIQQMIKLDKENGITKGNRDGLD